MVSKLQRNLEEDKIMKFVSKFFVLSLLFVLLSSFTFAEDITPGEKRLGGFCCVNDLQCSQYPTTKSCATECRGNCELGGCYKVDSCTKSVSFVTKYYWLVESKTIFIWYPFIEKSKDIFWVSDESKGTFLRSFGIGFLAGFWIWLFYLLIKISRFFIEGVDIRNIYKKDKEEIIDHGTRWLYLVAGHFWKVVLIGIGYWVLLQIPLIKGFVKIITLEFLGIGFFFQSFIVAFYIGYAPALLQYFLEVRAETKYQKKLNKLVKGVNLTSAQGKTN
ncbi:MAG: hypothetical protein QW727_00365 [Candidatus Pacearchaeota archaeon]